MKLILILVTILSLMPLTSYSKSWLIIANGQEISLEEIEKKSKNKIVIALDGSCNRLQKLSFYPNYILGDFDSIENPSFWGIKNTFSKIDENSKPYKGNFSITIIPAKDQNFTDLEKAIKYCDSMDGESILILQADGKRMDHTLANLGLLRKYHCLDRPIIIETEIEQIFYVQNEKVYIKGNPGDACAIMGYPIAKMTTEGLAYNGEEYTLDLGHQESISNELCEQNATILIQGEALLILSKNSRFSIEPLK
jgi:thiamine pyrophosphokinase